MWISSSGAARLNVQQPPRSKPRQSLGNRGLGRNRYLLRKEMTNSKEKPGKGLVGKNFVGRALYEKIYCPRGDMENRIKDVQLDLFGTRTGAHRFRSNYQRMLLEGFAYALITHIRAKALKSTKQDYRI